MWLTTVVCDENIFVPQVGDEVFFLKDVYSTYHSMPQECELLAPAMKSVVI